MFRTFLVSAALALSTPTALAGPAAEAVIGEAADALVRGAFDNDRIEAVIDTPRIARFALGRHARSLEPGEIDRFVSAFDTYIGGVLDEHAGRFAGAEVDVLGSRDRSDRDSIVTTRITLPGEASQTVRWRVLEVDGAWRVVDVEAFGLWLAIEQRAQLAAILDRRGTGIEDAIRALGQDDRRFAELTTDAPAS